MKCEVKEEEDSKSEPEAAPSLPPSASTPQAGFFLCTFHAILFFKNIIPNWDTWIESGPFPCSFLLASPRQ